VVYIGAKVEIGEWRNLAGNADWEGGGVRVDKARERESEGARGDTEKGD